MKNLIKFTIVPLMITASIVPAQQYPYLSRESALQDSIRWTKGRSRGFEEFNIRQKEYKDYLVKNQVETNHLFETLIPQNLSQEERAARTKRIQAFNNKIAEGGMTSEFYLKQLFFKVAATRVIQKRNQSEKPNRFDQSSKTIDQEITNELGKEWMENFQPHLDLFSDPSAYAKLDKQKKEQTIAFLNQALLPLIVGAGAFVPGPGTLAASAAVGGALVGSGSLNPVLSFVVGDDDTNVVQGIINLNYLIKQKQHRAYTEEYNQALDQYVKDPNSLTRDQKILLSFGQIESIFTGGVNLNSTEADFNGLLFPQLTIEYLKGIRAKVEENGINIELIFKELKGINSRLPAPLTDQEIKDKKEYKELQDAEDALEVTEQTLSAFSYYTEMTLNKLGANKKVVKTVKVTIGVTKAVIQFKKAITKFNKLLAKESNFTAGIEKAFNLSKGSDLATGIAAAQMTFNYVQIAMELIGLFIDSGPSPEQLILEGISDIKKQIAEMREEMHGRFNQVDVKLDYIQQDLVTNFDAIHSALQSQDYKLEDIKARLENILMKVEHLESSLYSVGSNLGNRLSDVMTIECGLSEPENLTINNPDTFKKCINGLMTLGNGWSKDGLSVKSAESLTPRDLVVDLNSPSQTHDYMTFIAGLAKFIPSSLFLKTDWNTLSDLDIGLSNLAFDNNINTSDAQAFSLFSKEQKITSQFEPFASGMANQGMWVQTANHAINIIAQNPEKSHLLPYNAIKQFLSEGQKVYDFQLALSTPQEPTTESSEEKKLFWTNLVQNYENNYAKLFNEVKTKLENEVKSSTVKFVYQPDKKSDGKLDDPIKVDVFDGVDKITLSENEKYIGLDICTKGVREHSGYELEHTASFKPFDENLDKHIYKMDTIKNYITPTAQERNDVLKLNVPKEILESIPKDLLVAKKVGLIDINLCISEDTWIRTKQIGTFGKGLIENLHHLNSDRTNSQNQFKKSYDQGDETWNSTNLFPAKYAGLLPQIDLGALSLKTGHYKAGETDEGKDIKREFSGKFEVGSFGKRRFVILGTIKDKRNINSDYAKQFSIEVISKRESLQAGYTVKMGILRDRKGKIVKDKNGEIALSVLEHEVIERLNEFEKDSKYSSSLDLAKVLKINRFAPGRTAKNLEDLINTKQIEIKVDIDTVKDAETVAEHYKKSTNDTVEGIKNDIYRELTKSLTDSNGALAQTYNQARLSYELLRNLTMTGFQGTFTTDHFFSAPLKGSSPIPNPYQFVEPLLDTKRKELFVRRREFPKNIRSAQNYDSPVFMSEQQKNAIAVLKKNFQDYYSNYFIKYQDKVAVGHNERPELLGTRLKDFTLVQRVIDIDQQHLTDLPIALQGIRDVVLKKSEDIGLRVAPKAQN
jgi:hypothetical protein